MGVSKAIFFWEGDPRGLVKGSSSQEAPRMEVRKSLCRGVRKSGRQGGAEGPRRGEEL